MSVFSIFKFIKDRLATVSDVSIQGSASPISCNVKKDVVTIQLRYQIYHY